MEWSHVCLGFKSSNSVPRWCPNDTHGRVSVPHVSGGGRDGCPLDVWLLDSLRGMVVCMPVRKGNWVAVDVLK